MEFSLSWAGPGFAWICIGFCLDLLMCGLGLLGFALFAIESCTKRDAEERRRGETKKTDEEERRTKDRKKGDQEAGRRRQTKKRRRRLLI